MPPRGLPEDLVGGLTVDPAKRDLAAETRVPGLVTDSGHPLIECRVEGTHVRVTDDVLGEQRQGVLVLLDGVRQFSGRSGGAGPCGGFRPVLPLEDAGEDLTRATVGGQIESNPICDRLGIRQVEVVLVASARECDVEPLSALGAGDHGVRGVDGGALGAVDGAGVPELHVLPDIFGRQPERRADPAGMMTGARNVEVAVAADALGRPIGPRS